ncbi:MAG TPA: hypothetical protein VH280_13315 [Verrucomicrobiae bacterium]|jgi:hypothetical protein|nr:hypothetical protein [Verrucomicrobiae bacterium]
MGAQVVTIQTDLPGNFMRRIDFPFGCRYGDTMNLKSPFCLFFRAVISFSAVAIILWVAPRATADESSAPTNSAAVKSGLKLTYTENFNSPKTKNLGVGWTRASHYGEVNEKILRHRLYFVIPSGHDIPWGSATLDLTNTAILGHGLHPGDYFEVTMRRESPEGSMGVELFDSDQLRVGSDIVSGESALMAWNGTTWVPISFDKQGLPLKFDWNEPHTIGVRFDSSDGQRANFNYYLDGKYVGSCPVTRVEPVLDKIGVYTQTKTANARFEFYDLKVYAAPGS